MTSMAPMADNGIISNASNHSVDETVDKLKGILQAKGVTLFALVDHSGEAEKVGMKMRPTKLLIFGNPKGGTPIMLAAPSAAIRAGNAASLSATICNSAARLRSPRRTSSCWAR